MTINSERCISKKRGNWKKLCKNTFNNINTEECHFKLLQLVKVYLFIYILIFCNAVHLKSILLRYNKNSALMFTDISLKSRLRKIKNWRNVRKDPIILKQIKRQNFTAT